MPACFRDDFVNHREPSAAYGRNQTKANRRARREDLLEPQRAQRTQRKMKMAHTRANLGILSVPCVLTCRSFPKRNGFFEPQRHRDTEGHRVHLEARPRACAIINFSLWPAVSLCLCGSRRFSLRAFAASSVVHKNPFLLGKDFKRRTERGHLAFMGEDGCPGLYNLSRGLFTTQ